MDFKQKKPTDKNEENYHIENLKIAREFSKQLLQEMNELVRSIVIFGSNTNETLNKDSDIDMMIVLNNVSVFVTDELREAYRIITLNLNRKIANDKIHIMTTNLTDLWDMARKGDPVLINVLRFGTPIFDRDLVEPLKFLLEIGKIKPTRESIHNYMARSETLIEETHKHLQNSLLDLNFALIDMVHSTLMCKKITPPSPKEMPDIFAKAFKDDPLGKYSKDIKEMYDLAKQVEYEKVTITGAEVDKLKKKTQKIIGDLKKYINSELEKKDNMEL